MNNKLKSFLGIIISICVIYTILFTCIDTWCFNRNFYAFEAKQLDLKTELGVNNHDLYNMSDTLLDYLSGYRNDIKVKVKSNGVVRMAYSDSEAKHMQDVRSLYQNAKMLRYVAIIVGLLFWLILRYENAQEVYVLLSRVFLKTSIAFFILISALLLYAASDFNTFWTNFHHVFFNNNLWLLPASSLMINLLPEPFFNHLVMVIIATFLVIFITLIIISRQYLKKWKIKHLEKIYIE